MLLLDRQQLADRLPSERANRFQLRLPADGQLVELPPGKITIGSSPRCNVRIERPEIHPLHCLIVHDAEGLTVRRWAGNARLNGQTFDDASLSDGDRLEIGSVEFELINSVTEPECVAADIESAAVDAEEPSRQINKVLDAADQSIEKIEEASLAYAEAPTTVGAAQEPAAAFDAAEEVFRRLCVANAVSRGRSRKLLFALRQCRDELNQLRRHSLDAEQQLTVLAGERNELLQIKHDWDTQLGDWQRERGEWQRQVAAWESRLEEQKRQLEELQCELAATRSNGVNKPAESAYELATFSRDSDQLQQSQHHSAQTADAGPGAKLPAAEWSAAPAEPAVDDDPAVTKFKTDEPTWPAAPLGGHWAPAVSEVQDDSLTSENWKTSARVENGWTDESKAESESGDDSRSTAWSSNSHEGAAYEDGIFAADGDMLPSGDEVPSEPADSGSDTSTTVSDESAVFAEFSIWNQGSQPSSPQSEDTTPFGSNQQSETFVAWEHTSAGNERGESGSLEPAIEPSGANESLVAENTERVASAVETPAKQVPTSYIERFSHLFTDDDADRSEPASGPKPIAEVGDTRKPQNRAVVRTDGVSQSDSNDDEESIEQYMAKLLQRVRGESPRPSTASAPTNRMKANDESLINNELAVASNAGTVPTTVQEALETQFPPAETQLTQLPTTETRVRKASPVVPTTDLGALRALANESARRAISQHQLRKHRRDAVTKVIVSTLAGMTSLWLMLESPHWRDIQFITACVSLIVAAYWAGETFRTMLESFRVAAYDGPQEEIEDGDEEVAALPIDVEPILSAMSVEKDI
jgi:hypothetical protein